MDIPPSSPLYVIAVDAQKNTITVSADSATAASLHAELGDLHWSAQSYVGIPLCAQSRYREVSVDATVEGSRISFSSPHIVTPGQSIVFYVGDTCVGGGIARYAQM